MRNTILALGLAVLTASVSVENAIADGLGSSPGKTGGPAGPYNQSQGKGFQLAPNHSVRYASERSPHKCAGATRVVLENFDPLDKNAKSALLQLDNNDVVFSKFGEQRVTTVFFQPFPVILTRLNIADSESKEPSIFSVTLGKEQIPGLGNNLIQLVVPAAPKSEPRGVRLLLLNVQGQVTDTLELRPPGNRFEAMRFSVSLGRYRQFLSVHDRINSRSLDSRLD